MAAKTPSLYVGMFVRLLLIAPVMACLAVAWVFAAAGASLWTLLSLLRGKPAD